MSICKWKTFTKEEITNFLLNSNTKTDFLFKMGYKKLNSDAYNAIKKEYPDLPWEEVEKYGQPEDLTGFRSGRLTVLYLDKNSKKPHWICKCDCGEITKPIAAYSLKHQLTQSCGCLHKERSSQASRNDLTGKRFGKLIAKELVSINPPQWRCLCDCGKEKIVKSKNLISGRTQSCGCLISQGELKIMNILDNLGIPYQTQYTFPDLRGKKYPLRFDFAIFDDHKNLIALLEYQGEQHYRASSIFAIQFEDKQEKDKMKKEYCRNNNLKLIEIPYWDYKKISSDYLYNLIYEKDNIV